ncbi:MAG TPA: class I mannose-6-phosphate isomerase [Pirellulaceae bacterium]|nr:class I mannose-6-phosphate isomerase [Pirellulaceae bacterium]
MDGLAPLRFAPLYRQYLWGGRRLESLLGKRLGDGPHYAESWEVVDHGADQSIVLHGPHAGKTLAELLATDGLGLLGPNHCRIDPRAGRPVFPLLMKFLDAHQNLSVQVHPSDEQAARLDPPDLGKTEAWVVLHADPGSAVYAGLKRGFDRRAFEREVRLGTTALCLNKFEPRVGDCIFIPAGTVHALGAGIVVAEIQQASDTTFRLWDWNRLGADGKPRPLHIDAALEVVRYDLGPVSPCTPAPTERPHVSRLVECDKFTLERWKLSDSQTIGGDGRFHIVTVLDGAATLQGDPANAPLLKGETALIPAGCGPLAIAPWHPESGLNGHNSDSLDSALLLIAYLST